MNQPDTRYGWASSFPGFENASAKAIRTQLADRFPDSSPGQINAWDDSIPLLQRDVREILAETSAAKNFCSILEYELPLESRRPDVIFLLNGAVAVFELKGKSTASQADLDQTSAYARDLRLYHADCHELPVACALIPTRGKGFLGEFGGISVLGPDYVDRFCEDISRDRTRAPLKSEDFLQIDKYRPLPTLVKAARELFFSGNLRRIERAAAATEPATARISQIVHEAARNQHRALILVTGKPGSGKTLVGLQAVHAHYLDDLAVSRADGKPPAPAVFLSGNGPLVEVLQYELKAAGGGGKAFVRGVKDYVKTYSKNEQLVPPQHVLVFDEAQRAFDASQVTLKHPEMAAKYGAKSEPELFIQFAERIPTWCAVIGLIGSGQEIHVGEEGGIVQWRTAIEQSTRRADWRIYASDATAQAFSGLEHVDVCGELSLDTQLRFHLADDLHRWVESLLAARPQIENQGLATKLEVQGFHLRISRNLEVARTYLRDRYADSPEARFGLIASSKDKILSGFGVPNEFQATKQVHFGPWYSDGTESINSCRNLREAVTEFGAQGLELDAALLAWGTDLRQNQGHWDNALARGYMRAARVRDPFQLRVNAYRVLLTRSRDAIVVYVPELNLLDETFDYLVGSGFKTLQ